MSTSGKSVFSVEEKNLPDLPPHTTENNGTYRWIRQISVTLWLWELLSLLVSMACIGAIVGIMAHYDGQPVPNWSYGLTINGIISILAGVAKSSLVLPVTEALSQLKWCWFWKRQRPVMDFERFDNASRGPWGSLTMLVHVRMWSVGALGAALTVAALAVEPSLQQIPAYPSRPVRSGSVGIGRSIDFSNTDSTYSDNALGKEIKGAFYMGMFGTNESIVYQPNCPTGNCTWPIYSSLGVCSACADLTPVIHKVGAAWMLYGDPAGTFVSTAGMDMQGESYGTSIMFPNATGKLLDIKTLYWPPSPDAENMLPPSAATECILYFCVKTFSSATVNGEYTETIVSSWPEANSTLANEPEGELRQDIANVTTTAEDIIGWRNYTLTPPSSEQTYSVDRLTFDLLRAWVSIMFTGMMATGLQLDDNEENYQVPDIMQAFMDAQNLELGPNKTVQGYTVPSDKGPGKLVAQMATAISTHLRQTADTRWAVMGHALSVETFVQARWYWAIFPMALLFLTLVFMVATVATCARAGVPIWKSSSLAILLHGLDVESCQELTAERLSAMEANAHEWSMQAQRGEERWRLQGSQRC